MKTFNDRLERAGRKLDLPKPCIFYDGMVGPSAGAADKAPIATAFVF
jgi:hypothetical protein